MKDDLPLSDSIALLNDLATPLGIRASRSSVANYAAIFARDAIMAARLSTPGTQMASPRMQAA